jgi:hypothetical protein
MSDMIAGAPQDSAEFSICAMFADPVLQSKLEDCYSLWITSRIEIVHRQKCPDLEIEQHISWRRAEYESHCI